MTYPEPQGPEKGQADNDPLQAEIQAFFVEGPQNEALARVKTPEDVTVLSLAVLDSIPFAVDQLEKINAARQMGRDDRPFVLERKTLFRQIELEVALIAGVEIEAAEHEKQNTEYREKIREIIGNIDQDTDDLSIMEQLGIVRPVPGENQFQFSFPSRIFPPYILEQWKTYTGIVEQFEIAADDLRKGMKSQTEFRAVDLIRTSAHDTVSQSIASILEFPGWEHSDYRRFVEKMRDAKFATSMGEVGRYATAMRTQFSQHLTDITSHHDGLSVLDKPE